MLYFDVTYSISPLPRPRPRGTSPSIDPFVPLCSMYWATAVCGVSRRGRTLSTTGCLIAHLVLIVRGSNPSSPFFKTLSLPSVPDSSDRDIRIRRCTMLTTTRVSMLRPELIICLGRRNRSRYPSFLPSSLRFLRLLSCRASKG